MKNFILATVGAALFACSVVFFYDPYTIAPGGITGLAVIISHIIPFFSTGSVAFLINLPLLIFALFRFGKRFVTVTVYVTVLSSVLMNVLEYNRIDASTSDLLVPAICGAILDALGLGLVYRAGGCTGGADIIVKFLRQKYRHIRTGGMYLIVNAIVLTTTLVVFGDLSISVYSALAMALASFLLDKILYGAEEAVLVLVISDEHKRITNEILTKTDSGVTLLCGKGAYTDKDKQVVMCAVKKHVFPRIRDIVKNADPFAFMIVSSAKEIFGEGYKSQFTEEL